MYQKILAKAKYHKIYDQVKILFGLIILLFIYGTFGYSFIKNVDLPTGLALTVETLEFMHAPETTLVSRIFQVSLFLIGGIFLWFAVWTFFEFVFKGTLTKYITEVIQLIKAKKAKNHAVICGGGRVGSTVAKMLIEKRDTVVIIEKDAKIVEKLRKEGLIVVNGDALSEEVLKEANVENARVLIAAISSGEKNVLLTISAKQINPQIEILARSDDMQNVKKLKSVGAKHVIMPEISGAKELISLLKK